VIVSSADPFNAASSLDGLWLVNRHASALALQQVECQTPRLSMADRDRAGAMAAVAADRAQIWRTGRIALRLVLEQCACSSGGLALAEQIRQQPFDLTAHGEPSLAGVPFVFSQSDAGPYLLIGVSSLGRIGVDLEQPRAFAMSQIRQARIVAAARHLAPAEVSEPLSLLQAWTRIEAFAKARGPSLARVLTELGLIGVAPCHAADPASAAVADISGLQVQDLSLPYGLIASIARPKGLPAPPLTMFGTAAAS
jgi:phosphopantetheinyl transferase